jgi:L-alanine-DL-glutamate epimerase-like enolase superfamily enzyme
VPLEGHEEARYRCSTVLLPCLYRLTPGSGGRTEIAAYVSGLAAASSHTRIKVAVARHTEGFQTLKLFHDWGGQEFLDTLAVLQRAPGDAPRIAADAPCRFKSRDSMPYGQGNDHHGPLWLDAPLPPEDVPAQAALACPIRTPIAIGESDRTHYELAPCLREGGTGYQRPELGPCSFTEDLRIARTAQDHGGPIVPCLNIGMSPQIVVAIHCAAALPNCEIPEFNPTVLDPANRFIWTSVRLNHGQYHVPIQAGPGADMTARDITGEHG